MNQKPGLLPGFVSLQEQDGFSDARESLKGEINMAKIAAHAQRLRIYVGESDRWEGKPLYEAIVRLAKEKDMGGATVLRGVMGYGANSRIHTAKITDLSSDLPILIEMVDSPEHIAAFLPLAEAIVGEGMITLDEVSVVKYGRKPPREKGV